MEKREYLSDNDRSQPLHQDAVDVYPKQGIKFKDSPPPDVVALPRREPKVFPNK